jgi:hypothetical protein
VTRFTREINGEPGKNRVDGFDPTEPPTTVGTTSSLSQLRKGLHMATLNLTGCGQFFEFCSHNKIAIFPSRIHYT